MSRAPKLRTIEAVWNVEKVHYTTGVGQNQAAVYEDEDVYELPK